MFLINLNHIQFAFLISFVFFCSCVTDSSQNNNQKKIKSNSSQITKPYLVILGTIQDGGSPHVGCKKNCCKELFAHPDQTRKVVSLGLIDSENQKKFLFEATPDMPFQMKNLLQTAGFGKTETPDGIFLTHAHIGHYTGLMYLGKEAMNSENVNVYVMARMKQFIEDNGPWSQLVNMHNIILKPLTNNQTIQLTSNIKVTPFTVPHRDEYSETVGYSIDGPKKKAIFIPDINKWSKWDTKITDIIKKTDYAFIDATFYDGEEINNRNINEIPHPFIIESMNLFKDLSPKDKNKIYFIHFNHTNPVLNSNSKPYKTVVKNGFHIAEINQTFEL